MKVRIHQENKKGKWKKKRTQKLVEAVKVWQELGCDLLAGYGRTSSSRPDGSGVWILPTRVNGKEEEDASLWSGRETWQTLGRSCCWFPRSNG
jgi:hypothetical protein